MYLDINTGRLSRLTITGYRDGAQIAFCPHCEFQYPPDTVGSNTCPNCGNYPLHVTTNTQELRALIDLRRQNLT